MVKNTIKCCFCYLDKVLWFLNVSPEYIKCQLWRFDFMIPKEKVFIKEIVPCLEYDGDRTILHNRMTLCCVKCYQFQVFYLSSLEEKVLDNVKCRMTVFDTFTYGDELDDYIYIGNSQFDEENRLLSPNERKLLYEKMKSNFDNFSIRPEKKSCFTSLEKCLYKYFCITCKNIYKDFFTENLIELSV